MNLLINYAFTYNKSPTKCHFNYQESVSNNNNASVFKLRRLHHDDNERVITTLWTEAHYI